MDIKVVLDFLSKLGEQVNEAGQQIFQVYVRQAYVDGISDMIKAVIYLVLIISMAIITPRLYKLFESKYQEKKQDRIENGTGWEGSKYLSSFGEDGLNIMRYIVLIGTTLMSVVLIFLIINYATVGIKEIMNPQYYALQNLFNAVKSAVK